MERIRKTILLTPSNAEQCQEIAAERGLLDGNGDYSFSELIRYLIADKHAAMQPPPYIRKAAPKKDPAEKLAAKAEEKRLKREKFLAEKRQLCELLKGEVLENGGSYECKFTVYDKMNPKHITEAEWTKPFEQLTMDTVTNQFRGQWTEEEKNNYAR